MRLWVYTKSIESIFSVSLLITIIYTIINLWHYPINLLVLWLGHLLVNVNKVSATSILNVYNMLPNNEGLVYTNNFLDKVRCNNSNHENLFSLWLSIIKFFLRPYFFQFIFNNKKILVNTHFIHSIYYYIINE